MCVRSSANSAASSCLSSSFDGESNPNGHYRQGIKPNLQKWLGEKKRKKPFKLLFRYVLIHQYIQLPSLRPLTLPLYIKPDSTWSYPIDLYCPSYHSYPSIFYIKLHPLSRLTPLIYCILNCPLWPILPQLTSSKFLLWHFLSHWSAQSSPFLSHWSISNCPMSCFTPKIHIKWPPLTHFLFSISIKLQSLTCHMPLT